MTVRLWEHPSCIRDRSCVELTAEMQVLFSSGRYDYPASILSLSDYGTWLKEHRTTRKRAARCERLGYFWAPFERAAYADDIFAINTSLPERQGRPMSPGYTEPQEFSPLPHYPCARHSISSFGVFRYETLVAYTVIYVSGEMAMVSQILGHGEHLENDVMYLLMRDTFGWLPAPLTVFYNRHDSGTSGLRYFKERLGFQPERVAWAA